MTRDLFLSGTTCPGKFMAHDMSCAFRQVDMKRSHGKETSTKTFKKKTRKGDYQKGRELARTPKQELKAFDVGSFTINFSNPAGTFQLLNGLINGSELYQRVGRKIYMKSLHIRGFITNSATSVQDMVRIIVFYDSQPNAGVANIATLLQDSNAGAATSIFSEINLTNRQRFKILRDYQMVTPSTTVAAAVQTNIGQYDQNKNFEIDFFVKLKGLETVYNGVNGGTIADITSGSLYVCTLAGVNNGLWALNAASRLRYYD